MGQMAQLSVSQTPFSQLFKLFIWYRVFAITLTMFFNCLSLRFYLSPLFCPVNFKFIDGVTEVAGMSDVCHIHPHIAYVYVIELNRSELIFRVADGIGGRPVFVIGRHLDGVFGRDRLQ